MLKVTKTDPKRINYNGLKGSGLFYRSEPFCKEEPCKPKPNPTPKSPVPQRIDRIASDPLCATKASPSSNQWNLNGSRYPNFNSLWVNIPKKFTELKVNG